MTETDEVAQAIALLVSSFPHREVSKATLQAYRVQLADIDPALLKAAIIAVVREHRYATLPQVGDIVKKAEELARPEEMTGELAWEQLQRWGRSGERSESSLHPDVLVTVKTFGEHGAWNLTDPSIPVRDRSFQRADFISAWNDWNARRLKTKRQQLVAQLTGVDLKRIGEGVAHGE